jgi:hypothetical protein
MINFITCVIQDRSLVTVVYDGEPRVDAVRPELEGRS